MNTTSHHRLTLVMTVVCAAAAWTSGAAVIEVPDDHGTIVAAIAAAQNGDTIRVAPGTYVENIDFGGKAITLTSHYEEGGDWSLVERTVIDGSGASSASAASTVTFQSGEARDSVLSGVTITGGSGTEWVDPGNPGYTWHGGAGIFIFGSSPTIRFCVITDNHSQNDGAVDGIQGGGVLTYNGLPLIHNTIISGNRAVYGGGLVVDYSGAEVRNCLISNNTVEDTYGGGGVWTIGASDDPITLTNCTIVDNVSGSYGGGMLVWNSVVELNSSIVWGNEAGPGFENIDIAGSAQIIVTHSDVEGGIDGEGNLNLDPGFAETATYTLDLGSPCIDTGDPEVAFNDPEDPETTGAPLWPALGGLRNDMGAYGGPGAMALSAEASPTTLLIPAAVHAQGDSESFFVTDVEVHNPGTRPVTFHLTWLPRNTDNSEPEHADAVSLAAKSSTRFENVLQEVFGLEETAGALAITTNAGTVLAMSRTYNLSGQGTVGQALPGVSTDDLIPSGKRARILFMTENDDYRSNLGLVSGVDIPITITWRLRTSDGPVLGEGSIQLPPLGNTQVNRLFAAYAPVDAGAVEVWTTTSGGAFTCYGSVIDEETNDPTTVLPQ